jgi:hypothetical protein
MEKMLAKNTASSENAKEQSSTTLSYYPVKGFLGRVTQALT